jgi:integrase/recombinase XerD
MNFAELDSFPADPPAPFTDQLRLAVAYLARFKGSSREHTASDLRCYLSWCAERGLAPLAARRPHLELYIRWMQEIRRFKPSTVSRRFSVLAGSATSRSEASMIQQPARYFSFPPWVGRGHRPPHSPQYRFGATHDGGLGTRSRSVMRVAPRPAQLGVPDEGA